MRSQSISAIAPWPTGLHPELVVLGDSNQLEIMANSSTEVVYITISDSSFLGLSDDAVPLKEDSIS